MYQVIYQDQDKIEIALTKRMTEEDFSQMIHQLESLCTMYPGINVLLDATELEFYDLKLFIDQYEFYSKYKSRLTRIAIVADSRIVQYFTELFNVFTESELRSFKPEEIESARQWIFPSKLPG